MNEKVKEILEELQSVIKGKTIDALFPPVVLVIANGFFGLTVASLLSIGTALLFSIIRLLKKQDIKYAFGGLISVMVAAGFAYFAGNARDYFIPRIISSTFMLLLTVVTLFTAMPLSAWASHLTRGWPKAWFKRNDIKPAYFETTILWAMLFAVRLTVQIILYRGGDLANIFWINSLIGIPFTGVVLIFTYIYGIWRLRNLQGPGVDEFKENKPKPWKGQTRGF